MENRGDQGKRLNKFIADSGYCSRREADRLIQEGRVTIDGRTGGLGDRVLPGMRVVCDGHALSGRSERVYIALNKPRGIVCTADPREPMNVVDYIGYPARIFPVGRLDKDSEGLLLLTSDGEIVNRLLRAAGGHEKEYEVEVDRPLTREFMQRMMAGVPILDTVTLPCRLRRTGERSFNLILVQGLNRQIRRMCEYLGYRVLKLRRVRINNLRIGALAPGEWRELKRDEVDALLASIRDSSNLPAAEAPQFRLAEARDLDRVCEIYSAIHALEETGAAKIGWSRGVYPTRATAEAGLRAKDLYVAEQNGRVLAAARINAEQPPAYARANWRHPAPPERALVLHTLVVDPAAGGKGLGTAFVRFYERLAREGRRPFLRMDTNEKNAAARALYARLGYAEADTVPCEFNGLKNVNLVCLEKKLED